MPGERAVADVLTNPVRMRIVNQLGGRRLTTAQLRTMLPDVAQPTLYRHIAALLDLGFVEVVEERRVRGAVERTLALTEAAVRIEREEAREMSAAQLRSAFLAFLAAVGADFDRFLDSGSTELRDCFGFGGTVLYVDTKELAQIQQGLGELLAPYLEDRGEGRMRVNLATVLTPEPGE